MLASNRWVVVTSDHDKAERTIAGIVEDCGKKVHKNCRRKDCIFIEFEDGTTLKWLKAIVNCIRGHRYGRLWCDRDAEHAIQHYAMYDGYFGSSEDVVWI